jgi:dTDP-4-dehydrorhamnose 3,5-epimerase
VPFTFTKLHIPDVILITPQTFTDDRGFFSEIYKADDFKVNNIPHVFVQDNLSKSSIGVLRGLHYQINPKAQGKLVQTVVGSIFDVVVDIRLGSPNYGKWAGQILSAENKKMLWVPPGFAHGILVLEENTVLLYKMTQFYNPKYERSIRWDDPFIGINWPDLNKQFKLTEKDREAPFLSAADNNFIF